MEILTEILMETLTYENAIVGYKAMNFDQRCLEFKYKEGCKYKIDGRLAMCENGFHFCESLRDTVYYYNPRISNVYAEVRGWGDVERHDDKIVASEIEIVRFLGMEEFVKLINVDSLTKQYDLYSENPVLLVASDYWRDRVAAAELGLGLDTLINDEDEDVCIAVAKRGYGLDRLVNDERWRVRAAVAGQGYGLAKLIKDEYWPVREAVAKQGYGLEALVNDDEWFVRETARKKLKERKKTTVFVRLREKR